MVHKRKTWMKVGPNTWVKINAYALAEIVKAAIRDDEKFLASIRCPHCVHASDLTDSQAHNNSSPPVQEHEFFPFSDEVVSNGQKNAPLEQEDPQKKEETVTPLPVLEQDPVSNQAVELISQEESDAEVNEEEPQESEVDQEDDPKLLRRQLASDPKVVEVDL